jgi:hypothetical protein
MAVQQSVLQMVETAPPAKGKLPASGQSSADNTRKFEREMDKVQADQQAPRNADQAPAPSRQSEAPAQSQTNAQGQNSANADQTAQKAEPNGKTVATDQSASAQKPVGDHTAQSNQNSQATKSEIPAEIANLTNWHILEQAANKRDPKDKTNAASLMDSVAPHVEGETVKTGEDHTTLTDVAAQIKSIVDKSSEQPVAKTEGTEAKIDPQLAKQLEEAGEKATQGLDAALKEGEAGKDTAVATDGNSKPVIDTEATSTKAASDTGIIAPSKVAKAAKSESQNEQPISGVKTDGKSATSDQEVNTKVETTFLNGDTPPEGLDAKVTGEEEQPIAAKTKAPGQQTGEHHTNAPTTQDNNATKLSDEQLAKAEQVQETSQPAKTVQPQNAQGTTDAASQNTQSQSAAVQSSNEGTAPATQSKEALAAQRAANDPDQKQAASEDSSSDADKPETRADAKTDKTAPTVNDRQEQLAKLRSPKGAIFSELMAGVKADPNQMTNLDGANDLFDPTAEMDLSTAMSQDRSVRLTGFDAFAKTGNLPTSTSLANAQAIAAQISRHVRGGENRFEIRLDPAELGKIDVRLTVGSDGQTRAHLFVERPETMDFLMRDQRMLERTLQQSGLQLEDQGLEFSLMDQGDQNQQWSEQQDQSGDDIFSSSSDIGNNSDGKQDEPVNGALAQTYVATDGVNLVI